FEFEFLLFNCKFCLVEGEKPRFHLSTPLLESCSGQLEFSSRRLDCSLALQLANFKLNVLQKSKSLTFSDSVTLLNEQLHDAPICWSCEVSFLDEAEAAKA